MRIASLFFFFTLLLVSCGSDPVVVTRNNDTLVKSLELPFVYAGMPVDTTFPALRISALKDSSGDVTSLEVQSDFVADSIRDTVNVYVDELVRCSAVDSIIDSLCTGKDLRLIGVKNGIELAIPFHTYHRFLQRTDTAALHQPQYHQIHLRITGQEADDSALNDKEMNRFFTAFYGNAWAPHDSLLFPQRRPHLQDITSFMYESQSWEGTDVKGSPDSAAMLAAYNEFVNRMEIFQKMGPFYIMREGLIDLQYDTPIVWGNLVQISSIHYQVQDSLRKAARQFLNDKILNEGETTIMYEFTDEDLLMLYPDRLRWNGRMSGPTENRYDTFHLKVFRIAPVVPAVKPSPPPVRLN